MKLTLLYTRLIQFLLAVSVIGLPLTSFPLYSSFFRALVAPFSALPIFLLMIIWFIPYVLKRGSMPVENQLIVYFILITFIASAAGFFLNIPTFKSASPLLQEIRAMMTLAIGMAFLIVFSSFPKNEEVLGNILKYINIGGIIMVLVALIQSYFILNKADYPAWFWHELDWLSIKPSGFYLNPIRVSSLAYEASWFAHQMACFYLPFWLAATVERTSAFKARLLGLSAENILLPLGFLTFFMSSPRISFISLALVGLFLATILHKRITRYISNLLLKKHSFRSIKAGWVKNAVSLILVSIYIVIILGVLFLAAQRDWRVKTLIAYPPSLVEIKGILSYKEEPLLNLANRLAFFERMLYWLTGLRTFNQHPWFGVGLGNAGFYLPQNLPSLGYYSYEIREVLYRLSTLPNVKNFWIRLLAETGIAGFSVFCLWLYNAWRSARLIYKSFSPILRLVALMGQFSLLAFIGEGFSIDSFAMPYLWVFTGLISAAAFIYRQQIRQAESARNLTGEKTGQDLEDPEIMEPVLSPIEP
jgi:hypothetical protein